MLTQHKDKCPGLIIRRIIIRKKMPKRYSGLPFFDKAMAYSLMMKAQMLLLLYSLERAPAG
jgi:hypothetical protein